MPLHSVLPTRSQTSSIAVIIDAAAEEFAQHGLDGARLDNIAQRAKVTKQLIHHYYGSKDKLYVAVLEHAANLAVYDMRHYDYDNLDPDVAFTHFADSIFDLHDRHPMLAAYTIDQNLHHAKHVSSRNKTHDHVKGLTSALCTILERGAAAGKFRENVDAAFFLPTAVGILIMPFYNSNFLGMSLDADAGSTETKECWRKYAIDFLLSSLRPGRGDGPDGGAPRI